MVATEYRLFEIPDLEEVHLVSQRKYNLDEDRPWWEIAFFGWIWLPVVRFGFKWMHIAAPSAMEPDGTIVLIEQQGCFTDRASADACCRDEFYSVKVLPLDEEFPEQSVQSMGHRAPKSVMPNRYRRPYFRSAAKRRAETVAEQESISVAIAKVDSLRARVSANVSL